MKNIYIFRFFIFIYWLQAFSKELSKIVSNHEIIQKVGAIYVKGIHKESISLWLRKLGFW